MNQEKYLYTIEAIHDLRTLMASWDTFHDFQVMRLGKSKSKRDETVRNLTTTELRKCIHNTIPEAQWTKCNEIISKYGLESSDDYGFGTKNPNEKHIVQLLVDKFFLKVEVPLYKEYHSSYPASPEAFHMACMSELKTKRIWYTPDANQLTDTNLCTADGETNPETKEYRGYFDRIDAKIGSNKPEFQYCYKPEFQTYQIVKHDGSLFHYESITTSAADRQILFRHGGKTDRVDVNSANKVDGVAKFIQILANTSRKEAVNLSIYESIQGTFKLNFAEFGLGDVSARGSSKSQDTNRNNYVRCLYDIKRGGDYMTVEAAREANLHRTPEEQLYVFVSSDWFAIFRALLSGVPAVCAHKSSRDDGYMYLYSPKSIGQQYFIEALEPPIPQNVGVPPPIETPPEITNQMMKDLKDAIEYKGSRIDQVLKAKSKQWKIDTKYLDAALLNDDDMVRNSKVRNRIERIGSVVGGGVISRLAGVLPGSLRRNKPTTLHAAIPNPIPAPPHPAHHNMNAEAPSRGKSKLHVSHKIDPLAGIHSISDQTTTPYTLDREFDVAIIMDMFEDTHPLHALLAAYREHNIHKITAFEYILYRFICHFSH